MFKKFLLVLVMSLFVLTLTACGPKEGEATAYRIVHKDYVGVATVKVVDGVVDTVTLDEVYLPYSWAKVKVGTQTPDDVIVAPTAHGEATFAKYIVIGDKKFTGTERDGILTLNSVEYKNESVKYSATGIDDLFVWLNNSEENCKWYAEEVLAGKAFVAKADWTKHTYETAGNTTPDGKLGWKKSNTNYWPSSETVKGWKGNVAAMQDAFKGTKMDVATDKLVKNADDKFWYVVGVKTGATLSDFKDYYAVTKMAYDKAVANAK